MLTFILYSIPPVVLLGLGYFIGTSVEAAHFRNLMRREAALRHIGVTNLKRPIAPDRIVHSAFVNGQSVIASDYFKTFLAGWRNIFGGRVRSYERLLMRARREALLRLLEEADRIGASEVCNVRFETSTVGRGVAGKGLPSAEIHAYGTAVIRRPSPASA